jgi:hypothetical protein
MFSSHIIAGSRIVNHYSFQRGRGGTGHRRATCDVRQLQSRDAFVCLAKGLKMGSLVLSLPKEVA